MSAFPAETITEIGQFPITNTFLHTLIVDGILIGSAVYFSKHVKMIPQGFQNVIEAIAEPFYNLTDSIAHGRAHHIFPYFMSFFLFIVVANITGLFPGFGSIVFNKPQQAALSEHENVTPATTDDTKQEQLREEAHPTITNHTSQATQEEDPHVTTTTTPPSEVQDSKPHSSEKVPGKEATHHGPIPLLRGATSDINVTLALAIISVVATHILSIRLTGIKDYLSRFFSLNPVFLFVGLLELIGEGTKIMSLSFRLFGNIYAGEYALTTISNLFAFLFPLPFLFLEIIVGVVQALVFSILTLVFMSILTTPHHPAEGGHH